jgi:hypothetical protein
LVYLTVSDVYRARVSSQCGVKTGIVWVSGRTISATTDEALYNGLPDAEAASASASVEPTPDPAATDGSDPTNTVTKVDDESAALDETGASASGTSSAPRGTSSTQSIPSGLCYHCMVDFATKWAKSHNPNYRDWIKEEKDCTNFVSQALRAGGWRDDRGWYKSSSNWWYNFSNQTYTWTSADYWSRFALKRTINLHSVWDMAAGGCPSGRLDR